MRLPRIKTWHLMVWVAAAAIGSFVMIHLVEDPFNSPRRCAEAHALLERQALRYAADPTAVLELRCGSPFIGVPELPGDPCIQIRAKRAQSVASVKPAEYLADAKFHGKMKRHYRSKTSLSIAVFP